MDARSPGSDEKALHAMQEQWSRLKPRLRDMPPDFRDEIRSFLQEILSSVELDSDLRNKREVYELVARFLGERFHQPEGTCLAAAHRLCRETDEALLSPRGAASEQPDAASIASLEAEAKALIVLIKVRYQEEIRFQKFQRDVEIFFTEPSAKGVTCKTYKQSLKWDSLPAEVRKNALGTGTSGTSFILYQREA